MKILFTLLFLSLFSLSAQATEVLLDCNLGGGDTQQARVLSTDGLLVLEELTTGGAVKTRALSRTEWNSGKIKIFTKHDAKATLNKEGNNWFFHFEADGYEYSAYVQCR